MRIQALHIGIQPDEGGKITELYDQRLGRNLLAPALPGAALTLEGGKVFSISGWDEAFPCLEPQGELPTLGYAWRTPACCREDDGHLVTEWQMPGWRLLRDVTFAAGTLSADYLITNQQDVPAPTLWAAHVLYPLADLRRVNLPGGEVIPGPRCRLQELMMRLVPGIATWQLREFADCGGCWKFFVRATHEVVLHYHDARLAISTTAPWWGIWLNLGTHMTGCLGIEPTTAPTDMLSEVTEQISARGMSRMSWRLQVLPN